MRRALGRATALALIGTTGACFHYVPVQGSPGQGTPVRVELSRPVSVTLQELTANNVVQVRGEVVAAQREQFVISAFGLRSETGLEHAARGETVILPNDVVASVAEKRISPARTVLAGLALAAAGYLVQLGLRGAIGGSEGGDGGGLPR